MIPNLWTPVNRRTARAERRRRLARAASQIVPWVLIAAALLLFAEMVLATALALPQITAQALAERGM